MTSLPDGLAMCQEPGSPNDPRWCSSCQALLEVAGQAASPTGRPVMLWLQVQDIHAEYADLVAAGVPVVWGANSGVAGPIEIWIEDPPITYSAASAIGVTSQRRTLCGRSGPSFSARRFCHGADDDLPSDNFGQC
jgi:hypothetical protein